MFLITISHPILQLKRFTPNIKDWNAWKFPQYPPNISKRSQVSDLVLIYNFPLDPSTWFSQCHIKLPSPKVKFYSFICHLFLLIYVVIIRTLSLLYFTVLPPNLPPPYRIGNFLCMFLRGKHSVACISLCFHCTEIVLHFLWKKLYSFTTHYKINTYSL